MENSVDPSHLYWLHGDTAHLAPTVDHYEEDHQFTPFEYGIMKRRITPGRKAGDRTGRRSASVTVPDHPAPCVSRHQNNRFRAPQCANPGARWTMPTRRCSWSTLRPTIPIGRRRTAIRPGSISRSATKTASTVLTEVLVQDAMAWETQGAPTDRTQEHLGVGDEGIILLRKLLREQIEIVRNGGEPLGIVRDAKQESFDRVRSDQRAYRAGWQRTKGGVKIILSQLRRILLAPRGGRQGWGCCARYWSSVPTQKFTA